MLFPVPRVECAVLNKEIAPFGLSLSPAQIAALQKQEGQALSRTGRVCFGESILLVSSATTGNPGRRFNAATLSGETMEGEDTIYDAPQYRNAFIMIDALE